ncbi:late embryogenesis abundant protein Lea14-A [Carex littledalei]|uniref:Late embryogenesis abundant protein Lea14-A n=1 Tax=Carex littledalei TaxID=544730 RepID=A0A833QYE7_9POAL|nr:late embryogenesis abundant protein Lea14-A [Carex littledalei]
MAQLMGKAKDLFADKIAGVKKPEADLTDLTIKNVNRDTATFHSTLNVHNPYSHSIPICEISFTLKSAGREIASGTIPDPGSLKGDDITKLEVPLKVPYSILMSIMKDVGRDWDIDYDMCIKLTIDLPIFGNFTLPVSKKGEVKLPTLSDIF